MGIRQDSVKHIGTVISIDGNTLRVKMLQGSACSSCQAAKLCQSSETKEKEVDVVAEDACQYVVGEKVLLMGSVRQGLKATVWAYMLPIVLVVAVMYACVMSGCSETTSALLALGSLVPYFVGLGFMRDRFRTMFSFEVQKL